MVQASSHTLEAFLKLPETKPASEFINGQIFQKPIPQGRHSRVQGQLVSLINTVAQPQRIALALQKRMGKLPILSVGLRFSRYSKRQEVEGRR